MAEVKKTNLQNKVVVIGTGNSKFLKTGQEYEVTETLAKTLIKNKNATLKKGKD